MCVLCSQPGLSRRSLLVGAAALATTPIVGRDVKLRLYLPRIRRMQR